MKPSSMESVAGREPLPLAEARAFASAEAADLKKDLLELLEVQLHQPLMSAEPHRLSEEHRRRLLRAQEAVRAELKLLRACGSGEEVVLTILRRIDSGVLAELDDDARFLGFRSIADLGRELAQRAQASGLACAGPDPEGVEGTFPASEPAATPRVEDRPV